MTPALPRLKKWGQNFLADTSYADRIVAAVEVASGETVVEIGPGDGALTHRLARLAARLLAIEIDPRRGAILAREFEGNPAVSIVRGDVLDHTLMSWLSRAGLSAPAAVIGNLPYNAATPILLRTIEERQAVSRLVATVQKEVARRLVARPGDAAYGYLTLRAQMFSRPEVLFDIPAGAFRPVPKVTSSVVRFRLCKPEPGAGARRRLLEMISRAFQARRKTLPNALEAFAPRSNVAAALEAMGRSPRVRAEELSLDEFRQLRQLLGQP